MALSWNEIKNRAINFSKELDECDTNKSFKNDKERIEFLFELYEEYLGE